MNKIRVVISDDQDLILDGVKIILEAEQDIEVVATAHDGKEALEKIEEFKPNLALLDIRMPKMDGVLCTKLIKEKFPQVVVLILTTFDDEEYIVDALKYGASGYILKDITREKLVSAVRDAYRGELIMPTKVAFKLANMAIKNQTIQKDKLDLTEREREIAQLLSQGFTNKQIATTRSYSEGTVKNIVSSIYSKINISDRTVAALYLKENGI